MAKLSSFLVLNRNAVNNFSSSGLVVGAGVESEDVAYVPSNVHSGGHFYNSKSLELEGLKCSLYCTPFSFSSFDSLHKHSDCCAAG